MSVPMTTPHAATGAIKTKQPTESMQNDWYAARRGNLLVVRLTDGKTLTGTLVGYDMYTLTLTVTGEPEPILLYKTAIAFVMRKAA